MKGKRIKVWEKVSRNHYAIIIAFEKWNNIRIIAFEKWNKCYNIAFEKWKYIRTIAFDKWNTVEL